MASMELARLIHDRNLGLQYRGYHSIWYLLLTSRARTKDALMRLPTQSAMRLPEARNSVSHWTGTRQDTRTGKGKVVIYTFFLSLYPDLTAIFYLAVTCMSTTANEGDNRFGLVV